MAQIIPPITSLPIDSGAAPSVEDIQDRLPSICVDYLSHNWTEEDVWVSWRNMTRHKHEIANGVRLENASWRTWNKQRNKLRTISPETLNWLKDSDVTWLYGPLHTASVEPVRPLKVSSTDDRLGIDRPAGKPGILKHRTLTELLSIPAPTSPALDATEIEEEAAHTGRPRTLLHTKSDTHLARSNSLPARRRSPSVARRNVVESQSKEHSPDAPPVSNNKRHISFNTFVEQCISLDDPILRRSSDDSDSDDVLEMRRPSRFSHNSRSSSVSSTTSSTTIAKIAPGILKTSGSYTNNPTLPKLVYMPPMEYRSPTTEQPPAITSPFESLPPAVGQPGIKQWSHGHDDDYNPAGFDYFGGPDLTGTTPGVAATAASPYGRAPAVQAPPAQPKWRQQSADSSTASTSSSNSSLNGLVAQQPARSILKVRPSNPSASTPEPVSPPALFNYNPSVATGIGGMFGGYEGAAQAGIVVPAVPTNDREERGRSTSRGNGSSQYDRSASRGISVSSSSSSLASVSRSPVEASSVKSVARGNPPSLDTVPQGATWNPNPVEQSAAEQSAGGEPMDVDHSPDRSSTPTPHSSPQIVLRPLKDTSPSSLPHATVRSSLAGPKPEFVLPNDVLPTSVPPSSVAAVVANRDHDSETASPTLSQPVDDDDGSTLIGRATNIANTAKDLLGALWYGAQDDSARPAGRAPPAPRRS